MYDRNFFRSRRGQAAIASIAAMVTFVLLSSQIAVTAPTPALAAYEKVEIAGPCPPTMIPLGRSAAPPTVPAAAMPKALRPAPACRG